MNISFAQNSGRAALTFAAALLASITTAQATVVQMQDGNSTALVDVDSSAGMYQWTVDGLNHLNQQWFWYRTGTAQAPINSIGTPSWFQTAANKLNTTYSNASYGVEINYTLTSRGIGNADIDEGIKIFNYTASPLTFTFYQYSDFNLMNTAGGDQIMMDNANAWQWKGETQIAEGIIAPGAGAFEANTTGGAGSTLYKLANNSNLVLGGTDYASGDVTWAFQWDLVIAPNSYEILTKDKLLSVINVPEPSTLALISLGAAALLLRRRAQS